MGSLSLPSLKRWRSLPLLSRTFLLLLTLSTALQCAVELASWAQVGRAVQQLQRLENWGEGAQWEQQDRGERPPSDGGALASSLTLTARTGAGGVQKASKTLLASDVAPQSTSTAEASATKPQRTNSTSASATSPPLPNPHVLSDVENLPVLRKTYVPVLEARAEPSFPCGASLADALSYLQRYRLQSLALSLYSSWLFLLGVRGVWSEQGGRAHVFVVLGAEVAAGGFAAFQVVSVRRFRIEFEQILEACSPSAGLEIPSLILPLLLLIILALSAPTLAVMAYKLSDHLKWRTFHRTGASRAVARAERAIWLHQLFFHSWSTASRHLAPHLLGAAYRIALLVLTVLLMPLSALGWTSARNEWSSGMKVFLIGEGGFWVHTLFLVTQKVYMSTSSSFGFLTFLTSIALVFTSATLVLGCLALRHFEPQPAGGKILTGGLGWWPSFGPASTATSFSPASLWLEKDLPSVPSVRESHSSSQTIHITLPRPPAISITLLDLDERPLPSIPVSPSSPSSHFVVGSPPATPLPSSLDSPTDPLSAELHASSSRFLQPSPLVRPSHPRPKPHLTIDVDVTSARAARKVRAVAVNPDALRRGGEAGVVGSRWSIGPSTAGLSAME